MDCGFGVGGRSNAARGGAGGGPPRATPRAEPRRAPRARGRAPPPFAPLPLARASRVAMGVLAGGRFCVDTWSAPCAYGAYFLTHAHADHTKGLDGGWRRGTCYCTPATAALLRCRWGAAGALHARLVELPVGETAQLQGDGWAMAVTVIGEFEVHVVACAAPPRVRAPC